MSTWFPDVQHSWLERLAIKVIRHGVIPEHIAFIMDGNRRYATKLNEVKTQGHAHGFEKLTQTLAWCRDLGITQITLYTFSIENFKRPKEEVDFLMELFRKQAQKVLEEFDKIEDYEICIRVYGKINLLPFDVQQSLARMIIKTEKFNKFYLNICFAYTAREEITNALNDLKECCSKHIIEPSDINYQTISNALYSQGLKDPDIMVRTSGEIRLSDFLLWQTSFTSIFFLNALWPEFNIWHLFAAILNYQYEYSSLEKMRKNYFQMLKEEDFKFCEQIFTNKNDDFEQFMAKRELRIEKCYQYIKNKRKEYLIKIINNIQDNNNDSQSEKVIVVNNNNDTNHHYCNNHKKITEKISITTNNINHSNNCKSY